MSTPFTFGVVGAGWRAEFFVRLARLLSDQLALVGASVRRSEVAEQLTRRWGIPAFLSPTELVHSRRPDFVISCVPPSANPEVVPHWLSPVFMSLARRHQLLTSMGCGNYGRR